MCKPECTCLHVFVCLLSEIIFPNSTTDVRNKNLHSKKYIQFSIQVLYTMRIVTNSV